MAYRIIWWKNDEPFTASRWLDGTAAIAQAQEDFRAQNPSYGVTAVSVVDDFDVVVFRLGKPPGLPDPVPGG